MNEVVYPAPFVKSLLGACCEYRKQLDAALEENLEQARLLGMSGEREADLLGRIQRLETALAQANETIESVCCGEGLECPTCGKKRPCCCSDLGGKT